MKPPSAQIRILITQLQGLLTAYRDVRSWPPSDVMKSVELIKLISDAREWNSIMHLLPFISASEKAVAKAASDCLELLLSSMRPSLLLQLDATVRRGSYSLRPYLSEWDVVKPSELDQLAANQKQIGVFALASFHRDGFVREKATKALLKFENGEELPFLIIRLTDWVPQIRMIAEEALEQRITPGYLRFFVSNLALLQLVGQRQRDVSTTKRTAIISRVTTSLKQPQNQNILFDGLRHQDYTVRRCALNLLIDCNKSDWASALNQIISDKDLYVRRSAVELSRHLSDQEQLSTLRFLASDKSPSIRRAAIIAICDRRVDEGKELLMRALLDKSVIVRQYARWKLAKLDSEFKFREFYSDLVSSPNGERTIAAAAAGLGEVGTPADAQVIRELVNHPKIGVKKIAICALSKLDAVGYVPLFLSMLGSDNPSISNECQRSLERVLSTIRSDELWQVFIASTAWCAKRNIINLLNQLDKWDRISYLLVAASQEDPRVQELAILHIAEWENQYRYTWSYSKPNREQLERLVVGLKDVGEALPEQLRKALDLCFRTYNEN